MYLCLYRTVTCAYHYKNSKFCQKQITVCAVHYMLHPCNKTRYIHNDFFFISTGSLFIFNLILVFLSLHIV